ncbi:hypothetical protein Nocox_23555 [Nonomuraea coxensis DSM 45129]|uniref:DUF1440 domain-containing protein n=1 Tax=Nonomuraea coxensis DSM 45129 TaxID=1122611 RepID=A0ABX8U6E6_9ACTN|nr:DUF6789 family protein [Nonomuraea coxensis]QYC42314.1 hypothetical protein Nocox_23555 [Nonomuraea coxensis DSM 45129]
MLRNVMKGALGGTAATATMSVVMLAGSRLGLMPDQPPKRIARAMLPGHRHRPKPGEGVAGALAHLGFGAAAGSLYGLLTRGRHTPAPLGAGYALAIWLSSYQGWVPRLGILPPAVRDRRGRQAVMVAGHLVYGTTLALTLNRLNARTPGSGQS